VSVRGWGNRIAFVRKGDKKRRKGGTGTPEKKRGNSKKGCGGVDLVVIRERERQRLIKGRPTFTEKRSLLQTCQMGLRCAELR